MAITMQMRASATQTVCGPRSLRSIVPAPAALHARSAVPLARQQRSVAVRAAAEESKPIVAKVRSAINYASMSLMLAQGSGPHDALEASRAVRL